MKCYIVLNVISTLVISTVVVGLSASQDNLPSANIKSVSSASPECQILLEKFANVTANFTYCAIRNARPIKVCESCIHAFLLTQDVYNELKERGGQICKDQLFNLDRLEVVDSGNRYITSLWGRASCDACFTFKDGNITTELSEPVKVILSIHSDFNQCVEHSKNGSSENASYVPTVCEDCVFVYNVLNEQYNKLKESNWNVPVCMDIVDLMNTSRSLWSNELKCYVRKKQSENTFFIISSAIGSLPLLFYLSAYVFTKKKQQEVAQQNRWTKYFDSLRSSFTGTNLPGPSTTTVLAD